MRPGNIDSVTPAGSHCMVLFLDFDGVLHPERGAAELFSRVQVLWRILRACPLVEVVFSTSWREFHRFEELLEFVTHGGGEDLAARFIGMTPVTLSGTTRATECREWLRSNGKESQRWLALDDVDDGFSPQNLYFVDRRTGITDLDVDPLVERLLKNDRVSGH